MAVTLATKDKVATNSTGGLMPDRWPSSFPGRPGSTGKPSIEADMARPAHREVTTKVEAVRPALGVDTLEGVGVVVSPLVSWGAAPADLVGRFAAFAS
jgi:hypothetical protein